MSYLGTSNYLTNALTCTKDSQVFSVRTQAGTFKPRWAKVWLWLASEVGVIAHLE